MPLTDPAKELAETLARLARDPNIRIVDRISQEARVPVWSPGFFRILFEIINRINLVESKIADLPLDDDIKQDAMDSISEIKSVFSSPDFMTMATGQVKPRLSGSNSTVLKMLSMMIREKVSYPLLSEEERTQIVEEVLQLRDWLVEIESEEKDFIRRSLIEGLESFLFRIERLNWLGHGYALDGLREVIKAYLSLQGAQFVDPSGAELQDAILARAKASILRVLGVFDLAKENLDRADWALKAYGAVSALADGSATVAGLLK